MAERGGYRAPTNPAPVSGPGALSQRTDRQPMMQMPDAAYGEQQDFQQIQAGAPMAATPSAPPPTPLSAPTQMPDVPVTDGLPFGPGRGPSGNDPLAASHAMDMQMIAKYLPQFQAMAQGDGVPDGFRRFITALRANL